LIRNTVIVLALLLVVALIFLGIWSYDSDNTQEPTVTPTTTPESTTTPEVPREPTEEITEKTVEELPYTGGDGYIALASYYGYELAGQPMANGIPFEPWSPVVASWDYPLGTELLICDEYCTTAVVLDRGPAAWTGKDIDLSLGVAYWSGMLDDGVGFVYVEVVSQEQH
jgi:rare lipoprotein A